jgi:hypothetical protein
MQAGQLIPIYPVNFSSLLLPLHWLNTWGRCRGESRSIRTYLSCKFYSPFNTLQWLNPLVYVMELAGQLKPVYPVIIILPSILLLALPMGSMSWS